MPLHTDPSHMHPERPWIGQPTNPEGRRSSLGGVEVKPPDVHTQLMRLEQEIVRAHEQLNDVRQKLEPVMCPEAPGLDQPELKEPAPQTSLGASIRKQYDAVKALNEILCNILLRIEL